MSIYSSGQDLNPVSEGSGELSAITVNIRPYNQEKHSMESLTALQSKAIIMMPEDEDGEPLVAQDQDLAVRISNAEGNQTILRWIQFEKDKIYDKQNKQLGPHSIVSKGSDLDIVTYGTVKKPKQHTLQDKFNHVTIDQDLSRIQVPDMISSEGESGAAIVRFMVWNWFNQKWSLGVIARKAYEEQVFVIYDTNGSEITDFPDEPFQVLFDIDGPFQGGIAESNWKNHLGNAKLEIIEKSGRNQKKLSGDNVYAILAPGDSTSFDDPKQNESPDFNRVAYWSSWAAKYNYKCGWATKLGDASKGVQITRQLFVRPAPNFANISKRIEQEGTWLPFCGSGGLQAHLTPLSDQHVTGAGPHFYRAIGGFLASNSLFRTSNLPVCWTNLGLASNKAQFDDEEAHNHGTPLGFMEGCKTNGGNWNGRQQELMFQGIWAPMYVDESGSGSGSEGSKIVYYPIIPHLTNKIICDIYNQGKLPEDFMKDGSNIVSCK